MDSVPPGAIAVDSQLSRLCRMLAALLPGIVIAYSLLVDPLLNFGLDPGYEFGGVSFGGEAKSTALTKIFMPTFFVIALLLALQTRPRVPARLALVAIPGFLFLALAGLSALWAKAPITTLTLAIYQSILFSTLLISVCVCPNPLRIIRSVLAILAIAVVLNLVAVALFPPSSIGHAGIYGQKNTLGAAAGCAFVFGLFSLTDPRVLWRLVAAFTVVGAAALVLASDSKTVLMLVIVSPAAAIAIFFSGKMLRTGPIVTALLLIAVCVTGFLTIGAMNDFYGQDLLIAIFGEPTFTGRTEIWAFAYDYIELSPILGNGYRGFWDLGLASPKHGSEIEFIRTIGSGHNGFIDVALDLGIVGLVLVIVLVLVFFHQAGQHQFRTSARTLLYMSLIIFVVGRNMMESAILWSTKFDNLAFMLVGFLACLRELPEDAARRVTSVRNVPAPAQQADLPHGSPAPSLLSQGRP